LKHLIQRTAIVLAIMLFIAPVLFAYNVVLKSGLVIHFQKYRVSEDKLFYTADNGKEMSVALSEINIQATNQLNGEEEPRLNLLGFRRNSTTPTANQAGVPLGDIVKQIQPRNPNPDGKRVYTNDDFPESSPSTTSDASAESDTTSPHKKSRPDLQEMATYTEQEFANIALGRKLKTCEFPGRGEWQRRLYAARESQIADLRLCNSDRVSDDNGAQRVACSKKDSDRNKVESLKDEGRTAAQAWLRRQTQQGNPL
jgi:hypothetical protein